MITTNRRARTAGAVGTAVVALNKALPMAKQVLEEFKKYRSNVPPRGYAPAPSRRTGKGKGPSPSPAPSGQSSSFAPVNQGFSSSSLVRQRTMSSTGTTTTIRGMTVLGQVQTGAVAIGTTPSCLFFASSNPITFADRLQIMSSTYDKFVYKRLKLSFIPQVATSTNGQIAVAIDRDYTDDPQSISWAQTLSYESVANGSVWTSHSTVIGRDPNEKRTYFNNFLGGSDLRETEQFKFYLFGVGLPAVTALGYLQLEYEIDLISPVYAPTELGSSLSTFYMNQSTISAIFDPLSNFVSLTGLPSAPTQGDLYEIICQYRANIGTGLLIGVGGPAYVPPAGSTRVFARFQRIGASNTWVIYPDYVAAATSNSNLALYNSNAANRDLFSSGLSTWRFVAGTNSS